MLTRYTFVVFLISFWGYSMLCAQNPNTPSALDTTAAAALLLEADRLVQEKKLDLAKAKVVEAQAIYFRVYEPESPSLAESWDKLGTINYQLKNYGEAAQAWETALALQERKSSADNEKIAQIYNGLGKIKHSQRQYALAIEWYEKALDIRQQLPYPTAQETGDIYKRIGNCYRYLYRYDKSIAAYDEALDVYQGIEEEEQQKIRVASAKHLKGFAYMRKGDFDNATYWFEQALQLRIELYTEQHIYVAASYNDIGECLILKDEYERAIQYIQKSADIIIAKGGVQNENLIFPYHLLAKCYINLKDYETALFHINNAIDIPLDPKGSYINERPNFYSIKGLCLSQLEEYDLAIELYENIIAESTKDDPNGTIHTGIYYSQLADYYTEQEDFSEAIRLHKKALAIVDFHLESDKHTHLVSVLYRMGSCYRKQGSYDEAIAYFKQAQAANSFSDDFTSIISYSWQSKIAVARADVYFSRYEQEGEVSFLEASLTDCQYAIDLYEYQRRNQLSGKERIGEGIWPTYEKAIARTLLLSEKKGTSGDEAVFEYLEKSKALGLFEAMQDAKALKFANLPADLLEQETFLKIDINTYEKRLKNKLTKGIPEMDSTVIALRSKLFELTRSREAIMQQLEQDYPDYYQAKYDLHTLSIAEVQQSLLQQDESLLTYFVGDSTIFLLLVQADDHQLVEIEKDFPLADWVQELRQGIYGAFAEAQPVLSLQQATQQYIKQAQQLYEKLLAPVEDQLTESLIIIPDGPLGYLPFDVLLTGEVAAPRNFGSYPYLLHQHGVSYSYSATLLQEMRQRQHQKTADQQLLAVAPFYEKGYEDLSSAMRQQKAKLTDSPAGDTRRNGFDPLPNSGVEAAEVAGIWSGDYWLGKDATEDRFVEVAADYRILHLSTHGQADSRSGDYSFLVFAELADSLENELLYVRDLYNLQINADLVVLSACETAIGELQKGEGIISLNRAFAYAGAKSIVTTLWVADDNATKTLMIDFHQFLEVGQPKEEALRQAKLRYLQTQVGRMSHPFFWSGFIAAGDMRPLD
ncbi:MAG: CHAT domain-containing tetratricopeptide repeat protein [Bacteroidota bacterium]